MFKTFTWDCRDRGDVPSKHAQDCATLSVKNPSGGDEHQETYSVIGSFFLRFAFIRFIHPLFKKLKTDNIFWSQLRFYLRRELRGEPLRRADRVAARSAAAIRGLRAACSLTCASWEPSPMDWLGLAAAC